jgi:branched-chain amino acid transport system substrate-binding protein
MRNKRWAVTCTVLAMTALAACGESDDGGAAPSAAPSTSTSTTGGTSAGSLKIGVYAPATLPGGKDVVDGAALAAEELNAKGEGPKVELVNCDSEAMPQKAIACITKFAQTDKVNAISGGFSSAETLAAIETVVAAKVPYVSTGAASPDVTKGVTSDNARKYIFRIGPVSSTALAADICLTYTTALKAAGFTKFGILYEDVAFNEALVPFLQKCLPNPSAATAGKIPITDGVEIVGTEKFTTNASSVSAQFTKLKSAGAQYVIESSSGQVSITVAKEWGELKPGFALGGISVIGQTDAYFDATNKGATGVLNGPAGVVRAAISPKTIPFYDAFEKKFGRAPIYNGVSSYDSIYAIHEAAVRAGAVTADALVAELAKTNRVGAQGTEMFDEQHDVVYSPSDKTKGLNLLYFQYQADGSKKIVFPAAVAEGNKYVKPAGVK